MVSPLRLDWKGDADVPDGARMVATEVEWLRVASELQAPDAANVLVRGKNLCEWASQWWQAAGGTCEEIHSAVDTVLSLAPDLSRDEAKTVLNELGDSWLAKSISNPKLEDVLSTLFSDFGEDGGAWKRKHTGVNRLELAAGWLLWLEDQSLSDIHAKLIEHQAELWREAGEDSRDLFPSSPPEAKRALRLWLALDPSPRGSFTVRESFPLPLPLAWQEEAKSFYARTLTERTEGDEAVLLSWWRRFEAGNAPPVLREIAADTLAGVTSQHPRFLSGELIALVEPFLPAQALAGLRRLKPPAAPLAFASVSSSAKSVFDWTTQSYLPFRAWACENENADALAVSIDAAQEFGSWFLEFYARAMSGAGRSWLQIHRASELRAGETDEITFWVIADGLGWRDAHELARLVNEHARFSLSEATPLFATIPTITSIAKPSLRWSAPPSQVQVGVASRRREHTVAGHKEAAEVLSEAKAGDLVIWTPLEPDTTYHENADANVLRGRVAGALKGLSQNIVGAALAAPADVPFRIVVTTDHGRLLGSSRRAHPIPAGFTGHGRAAYGSTKPNGAGSEGVCYLDPDVYGGKSHVVIATDEGAFLTNASDGAKNRTGVEKFPHGGIFPEEVVVPWMSFERDAAPIHVESLLGGKGRAERAASATLRLLNSSGRALTLDRIEFGGGQPPLVSFSPTVVAPFSPTEVEVRFDSWPDAARANSLTAMVSLRTPDGRLVQSAAMVRLEVEALQTREEDILSDLF